MNKRENLEQYKDKFVSKLKSQFLQGTMSEEFMWMLRDNIKPYE